MTDLVPTREHVELADSVRRLLERRSDSGAVRAAWEHPSGFDPDLWSTLCDQVGVAALALPEELGGAGFTLAESHVVLEELGRALTPSPLLASLVTGTALVAAGAGEDVVGRVAAGEVATLAWAGVTGSPHADVDVTWDGTTLRGTVPAVLHGHVADVLLVAGRHDSGVGLFLVDPDADGLHRDRAPGVDPTLSFADLTLDGVTAAPVTLDAASALAAAHRVGTLAATALQVGCAERGLAMTVEHTQQREQFGRPLGSFQALKHRMADMLVRVRMARSGSWAAVQAHVHATPDADRLAAAAASYCAEAATAVAAETVQLHGGIGITWEHDAHLVLKRAQALHQLFGQPHEHRAALL